MFEFKAHTIETSPWGASITRILNAALDAVEPAEALADFIQLQSNHLRIGDRIYNLDEFERVFIVGAGKACVPMAQAAAQILGDRLSSGIVIVKEGYTGPVHKLPPQIKLIAAGHPLPDERGVHGTKQISDLLAATTSHDLVICLLSGGGSALLTYPAPGLTLEDLQIITSQLLACGATIHEINTLRKHLDLIKGGGLVRMAAPARLVSLILSDVIGNQLNVIASGPTVPDPSTFQEAWQILERYQLLITTPEPVRLYLKHGLEGKRPETLKPDNPLFDLVQNLVIGSNLLAAQAAVEQAKLEGFNSLLLTTYLQGEASQAGIFLAALLHQIASSGQPLPRPACLVAGGETTVTLSGEGLGGRNQELALATVAALAGLQQVALVTLATDGGDGPTDAAGAIVTGESFAAAQALGLEPSQFLTSNDAYHFFEPLGDLLKPGFTNTNVNDLNFIFAFKLDE